MMEAEEEVLFFNDIVCSGPELICIALFSSHAGRTGEAGAWDQAEAQHAPGGWDRTCSGQLMLHRLETADALLFQQGC